MSGYKNGRRRTSVVQRLRVCHISRLKWRQYLNTPSHDLGKVRCSHAVRYLKHVQTFLVVNSVRKTGFQLKFKPSFPRRHFTIPNFVGRYGK